MTKLNIFTGFRLRLVAILILCLMLFAAGNLKAQETAKGEFSGAADVEYPDWFKTSFLDLEEDVAEAAEAGKRLMILFHQDGCPYCNAFVEKNLAQKDIVASLQSGFDVIEINMWGSREVASVGGETYTEKEFAAALKVQFTPTILFLDENGSLALRVNGYYDPDRFRQVLEYVSEKKETQISFKEFREQAKDFKPSAKQAPSREYFSGPITELAQRPGKDTRPLLILFEQGSCKNCETLHEQILSRQESRELLNQFDVYQVDMWGRDTFDTPEGVATTGREWSREMDISYAPTMVLFSADGQEVIRSEAWFKAFHTQSILDYVASDSWREQPSFQRYISARADELIEQGIDVDLWD